MKSRTSSKGWGWDVSVMVVDGVNKEHEVNHKRCWEAASIEIELGGRWTYEGLS